MAGAKAVVRTFVAAEEPGQAAVAANGSKPVAASGQYLVHVSLVSDVPDDRIGGRVEHLVQRQCQFHHTEVRGQMPTVTGDGRYQKGTHLAGQRLEFSGLRVPQVRWCIDTVQQRHRPRRRGPRWREVHAFERGIHRQARIGLGCRAIVHDV